MPECAWLACATGHESAKLDRMDVTLLQSALGSCLKPWAQCLGLQARSSGIRSANARHSMCCAGATHALL